MTKKQEQAIENEFNTEGIIVNGCLIKGDTIYTVVPKRPLVAPDIYRKELESEKERLPGISTDKVFATVGGLIDNGFHPTSDVFTRMRIKTHEEREKLAEKYATIFLKPLETMISREDYDRFKDPRATDLYDGERYQDLVLCSLRESRQFDTSLPRDRFHMYLAVLSDGLVEKGKRTREETQLGLLDESNASSAAQYAYESKVKVRSNHEKATIDRVKATGYFGELMTENRSLLIDMLNYTFPMNLNKKDEDDTLYIAFSTSILEHEEKRSKISRFITMVEEYKDDPKKVKDKLEVYELILGNKSKLYNDKRQIVVGETVLGNPKSAAERIANNSELYSKFYEIVG